MPRYKLTIEYDGTGLVGWQRQNNGMSVQQAIEDACVIFAGQEVRLHVAGRTDAGVHGLGMVAHFDMAKNIPANKVQLAINHHIKPHKISILHCEEVDEEFHARFSCIERSYLYRILCRSGRPALDDRRVWWFQRELDVEAMNMAAQLLIGHHDFSTFRASQCQADSPFRTLDELSVERVGKEIHVRCRARSFLHHQVRNIVGTLTLIGRGKWSAEDLQNALDAKDRAKGGETAPAYGLYFVEAKY
ncbi:tRNA pseudouridine synthase A [Candidatus Terasakiella magnetica]|uniref:tRNA pseudouridine synthase A n=1 Tax=Candidatus Terasakiella magnetica TaxID=1867952 RepID=A0A1C3REB6_9PROT|nr:tRNA pseudouridine(38-40) synthase TruA [Candidatus Terasakiella magnetica]SCA55640.1 tRNA pseudouridine synthase A [Candidatus Terasakiella magnetica]